MTFGAQWATKGVLTFGGFDAYMLNNGSFVMYYMADEEVMRSTFPMPENRQASTLRTIGAAGDAFFLQFDDAVYAVGMCDSNLC